MRVRVGQNHDSLGHGAATATTHAGHVRCETGGRHCCPPQTCSSSTDQGRRRRRRRTCLEALPPSSSEPVTMSPREPPPPYPEHPLRCIPSPPPRRPRFEFRILSFGCGFRSTIPFLLKIFGSRVLVAGWRCWC